jgi:hypothetical protein
MKKSSQNIVSFLYIVIDISIGTGRSPENLIRRNNGSNILGLYEMEMLYLNTKH